MLCDRIETEAASTAEAERKQKMIKKRYEEENKYPIMV
jgi:hypothetical protein